MNEQKTWEEPYIINDKTEPVQSFEAFKMWVEMGNKRSLKAVAERMEKSHDTIKKYSCTWKWSERLQEKLSYESNVVYGKQLETVLTGLEMDTKRDYILQMALGNIVSTIVHFSLSTPSQLKTKTNLLTGKTEPNPNMETLERLTNLYSKLEQTHTKNQQKIIDYNHKCLSVQSFKNPNDYNKLIKNGKKEAMEFMGDYFDKIYSKDGDSVHGGITLFQSDLLKSYQPEVVGELETEAEPEAIPEPEATKPTKHTPRKQKKKSKRSTGRSRSKRGK